MVLGMVVSPALTGKAQERPDACSCHDIRHNHCISISPFLRRHDHPARRPYLMLPTEMPSMKLFWNSRNITITGSTISADAAISRLYLTSCDEVLVRKVRPIERVYLLASCK